MQKKQSSFLKKTKTELWSRISNYIILFLLAIVTPVPVMGETESRSTSGRAQVRNAADYSIDSTNASASISNEISEYFSEEQNKSPSQCKITFSQEFMFISVFSPFDPITLSEAMSFSQILKPIIHTSWFSKLLVSAIRSSYQKTFNPKNKATDSEIWELFKDFSIQDSSISSYVEFRKLAVTRIAGILSAAFKKLNRIQDPVQKIRIRRNYTDLDSSAFADWVLNTNHEISNELKFTEKLGAFLWLQLEMFSKSELSHSENQDLRIDEITRSHWALFHIETLSLTVQEALGNPKELSKPVQGQSSLAKVTKKSQNESSAKDSLEVNDNAKFKRAILMTKIPFLKKKGIRFLKDNPSKESTIRLLEIIQFSQRWLYGVPAKDVIIKHENIYKNYPIYRAAISALTMAHFDLFNNDEIVEQGFAYPAIAALSQLEEESALSRIVGIYKLIFENFESGQDSRQRIFHPLVFTSQKISKQILSGLEKYQVASLEAGRITTKKEFEEEEKIIIKQKEENKIINPEAEKRRIKSAMELAPKLSKAFSKGNLEQIKSLVHSGRISINYKNVSGVSLLQLAAYYDDRSIINWLIKSDKFNFNAKNSLGYTEVEQLRLSGNIALAEEIEKRRPEVIARPITVKERNLDQWTIKYFNGTPIVDFVRIEPGSFLMGEDPSKVLTTISKPFEFMSVGITQKTYRVVTKLLKNHLGTEYSALNANPSYFKGDTRPVVQVSHDDVILWVKGLNKLAKLDNKQIHETLREHFPGHKQGSKYALPTEAQWEYVSRLGGVAEGDYSFGNRNLDSYAIYENNSNGQTRPVGSMGPVFYNGKPLYDLHGNVSSWMTDWYGSSLTGGTDPKGPTSGSDRVIRGGSWDHFEPYLHSYVRFYAGPEYRNGKVGFRLVRVIE